MKLITIALLMISLVSCRSISRTLICNEIRNQEINHVQMCDISFQFNRCRCRLFDFNSWDAVDAPRDFPLAHCEGLAGFYLDDVAVEIRPKIKAMFRVKENLCQ